MQIVSIQEMAASAESRIRTRAAILTPVFCGFSMQRENEDIPVLSTADIAALADILAPGRAEANPPASSAGD